MLPGTRSRRKLPLSGEDECVCGARCRGGEGSRSVPASAGSLLGARRVRSALTRKVGRKRDSGQTAKETPLLGSCFVYPHLPKFASSSTLLFVCSPGAEKTVRRRSCVVATGPALAGSGFFDDFRAAANAVCFALRSANPRAPWQAVALAALFALASRWRFKHINKA